MKKKIKPILIAIGTLFALSIFIPVVIYLYIKTDHAQSFIRNRINKEIAGTISWEQCRFNILLDKIELQNVQVKTPSKEIIADIPRIHIIDMLWGCIFTETPMIGKVIVERPQATFRTDSKGKVNFLSVFSHPKSKKQMHENGKTLFKKIPGIRSFEVMQGSIHFEISSLNSKGVINNFNIVSKSNALEHSHNLTADTGTVTVEGSKYQTEFDKLQLSLNIRENRIDPIRLNADIASGKITLQGYIELTDNFSAHDLLSGIDEESIAYEFAIEQSETDLQSLIGGNNNIQGIINSNISVRGKGLLPHACDSKISLVLSAKQVGYGPDAAPIDIYMDTHLAFNQEMITVKHLKTKAGNIELYSEGRFNLISQELAVKLNLDAPKDISESLQPLGINNITGMLAFNADISGTLKQPVFDIDLHGKQLCFYDFTIGDIGLNAVSDHSGLMYIKQLDIDNQGSSIKGKGVVQIFKTDVLSSASDLSFVFNDIETKNFFREVNVTGKIDGKLELKGFVDLCQAALSLKGRKITYGPLQSNRVAVVALTKGSISKILHTQELKVRVNLEATDIDIGHQRINELTLTSDLSSKKIDIDSLQISMAREEKIDINGWISSSKSYQMNFSSKGLSLHNLYFFQKDSALKGNIALNISTKGTFGHPEMEGEILLYNLRVFEQPLSDFKVNTYLQDHLFHISGGFSSDSEIEKKEMIDFRYNLEDFNFSGIIEFQKTELSPFFKIADINKLSGIVSGRIDVRGNAANPATLEAAADFSEFTLFLKNRERNIEVIDIDHLKVSLQNNEITIPGTRTRLLKDGHINTRAYISFDGNIDIKLEGDISLESLNQFFDEDLDFKGNLHIGGEIQRTWPHPVSGRVWIELDKAGFTVPGIMQQVHDVNGEIIIDPDSARIRCNGKLDIGSFNLNGSGWFERERLRSLRLDLQTMKLPLKLPETVDLLLNSDIRLSGTPDRSTIEGQINILEGTYYKDLDLSLNLIPSDGGKARTTNKILYAINHYLKKMELESYQNKFNLESYLNKIELNLYVRDRNSFFIDNNLARRLYVHPDLHFHGQLTQPRVTGQTRMGSGKIIFQRKDFNVTKGVIDFLNPNEIEPVFELKTEAFVRDWVIYMDVSGTPDQLAFNLSSDPPENESDILSILLFDRPTRELAGGDTTRSSREILADIIESTIGKYLQKAAGLTAFENNGKDDKKSLDNDSIIMDDDVTRLIILDYANSLEGEMLHHGISEYRTLKGLVLNGLQQTKDHEGEIQFRLDFD